MRIDDLIPFFVASAALVALHTMKKTSKTPSPLMPEDRQLPGAGTPPAPLAVGEDQGNVASLLDAMDEFLESAGVAKYTTAREFCRLPNLPGSIYAVPPLSLWPNAVPTLRLFQIARQKIGKPIPLRGYRPPEYNQASAGADRSLHMWAAAVDLRPGRLPDTDRDELALTCAQLALDNAQEKVGLGVYGQPPNSIHLDTGFKTRHWAEAGKWLRIAGDS